MATDRSRDAAPTGVQPQARNDAQSRSESKAHRSWVPRLEELPARQIDRIGTQEIVPLKQDSDFAGVRTLPSDVHGITQVIGRSGVTAFPPYRARRLIRSLEKSSKPSSLNSKPRLESSFALVGTKGFQRAGWLNHTVPACS
jgi:hypothetical protein